MHFHCAPYTLVGDAGHRLRHRSLLSESLMALMKDVSFHDDERLGLIECL